MSPSNASRALFEFPLASLRRSADTPSTGELAMDVKQSQAEPRLLISRAALLHNAAVIRRTVGANVKICAVVKADAYGHGAAIVVDTLCNFSTDESSDTPTVDQLAVASIDEAAALPHVDVP